MEINRASQQHRGLEGRPNRKYSFIQTPPSLSVGQREDDAETPALQTCGAASKLSAFITVLLFIVACGLKLR